MHKYFFIIAALFSILELSHYMDSKETKKPIESKRLYFEFRTKDSSVTADGFLRYKGKWCPIVLNDSMAIIYQNNQ